MFRRNDFFPREKETENLFHPRVGLFILEIPSRGPKKEERVSKRSPIILGGNVRSIIPRETDNEHANILSGIEFNKEI